MVLKKEQAALLQLFTAIQFLFYISHLEKDDYESFLVKMEKSLFWLRILDQSEQDFTSQEQVTVEQRHIDTRTQYTLTHDEGMKGPHILSAVWW